MAKKKKSNISIKTQLMIATGIVLLLTLFGLFVGWLDTHTNTSLIGKTPSVSFNGVTLKGTSVCLEYADDAPHTMECALGLKTEDGTTYAIKGNITPVSDHELELTGTLSLPPENTMYKIAGTLTLK